MWAPRGGLFDATGLLAQVVDCAEQGAPAAQVEVVAEVAEHTPEPPGAAGEPQIDDELRAPATPGPARPRSRMTS